MPQIELDFSNVEEFEALPAGDYPVIVDHVELRVGQQSGNPYLNWDLTVADGEYSGRHLFMSSGLTERSLWRLKKVFENLGIYQDVMSIVTDDDSGYVIEPELSGLAGTAVVKIEMYQNRQQNRVDDLLSSDVTSAPIAPPAPAPRPAATAPVQKPASLSRPTATPAPAAKTPPARQNSGQPRLNLK